MIRRAVLSDTKAILNLHARAWRAAYQEYVSSDVVERVTTVTSEKETELTDRIKAGDIFIAEQSNRLVGYALVNRNEADVPELKQLYVEPALKRRGIGTLLLKAVQKELKDNGADKMIVWTMKDYPVSNTFYRKNGGVPTQRQKRLKINIDTVMFLFHLKGESQCR